MPFLTPRSADPTAGLPRLVLDTNVFFGAAWGEGNPAARLVDLWRAGEIVLCVSAPVIDEYRHILSKTPRTRRVLDSLLPAIESLPNTVVCEPVEAVHIIKKDRSDNKFVECAIAAGAGFIVSSDKHMRSAHGFRGLVVLSAGAYLERHTAPAPPPPASVWSRAVETIRRAFHRGSGGDSAG